MICWAGLAARKEMRTRAICDGSDAGELLPFGPHLRAFALALSGNVDQADDLVQEAFGAEQRKRRQFTPGTSLHVAVYDLEEIGCAASFASTDQWTRMAWPAA